MAGHSKWKQIKRKKAVTDQRRGALFTKLIREITIAAKQGGGDPAGNARLRTAIDAAKAENMPLDNIERAVKKGTGELEGVTYEEVTYEAYGPGGAALLIEATTDNANRTVAEIRNAFQRHGGNLGATNSVARSEEHTSELQSRLHLVCRLLLEKKKKKQKDIEVKNNEKTKVSLDVSDR